MYVLATRDRAGRIGVLDTFLTAEVAAATFVRLTGHDIDHLAIADDLAGGCTFECTSVETGRPVVLAPNTITSHTEAVAL